MRLLIKPAQISDEYIKNFITHLDGLNIETMNQCNLSSSHHRCPAGERYKKFGPRSLSLEVLKKLFIELDNLGFHGRIGLHHYSEPLIDKRIFRIIQIANTINPNSKINIWSNGILLTKEKGMKLMQNGVYWLRLSAYSSEEYVRLSAIVEYLKGHYPEAVYDVIRQDLDDRKDIYRGEILNLSTSCWDMEDLLIINSLGDLQLCCRDYLCTYTFGNIYKKDLTTILKESNYLKMREDLILGERFRYDLCSRCKF